MPKPLMMSRSAGLYARFFVPTDLRASIGSRYLVRSLGNRRGDHARLAAATMGMALSMAFDAMRKGRTVDLEELLEKVLDMFALDPEQIREIGLIGVEELGEVVYHAWSLNAGELDRVVQWFRTLRVEFVGKHCSELIRAGRSGPVLPRARTAAPSLSPSRPTRAKALYAGLPSGNTRLPAHTLCFANAPGFARFTHRRRPG